MTSSNRARRYLQHQKQYINELQQSPRSTMIDSNTVRKFRGKNQVQLSIPQICVNKNDDDEHEHVDILNEFDQILDEQLKHSPVLRTCSLKQEIGMMNNQQRSFSFALGTEENKLGDEPVKSTRFLSASKSSLAKERFSRLFHSLAFRSTNQKMFVKRMDSQSRQQSCLACQNYPYLNLIPKTKKRPSIFDVLVSKLNTTISSDTNLQRCSVCKRVLSKSISNNDDNPQQQQFSFTSTKHLRVKRRQSLPSLFHNLLDSSSFASIPSRPTFSTTNSAHFFENNTPEQSTISSMDSVEGNSFKRQTDELMEKNGYENNEMNVDSGGECHDLNSIQSNESMVEMTNSNQQFLHPPDSDQMMRRDILQTKRSIEEEKFMSDFKSQREKTRSLLINVFRTRRSNAGLTSSESSMAGKQFSISVSNLTTSLNHHRRNSALGNVTDSTIEQRKHALSEESLPSMDNTYIYFTNIHGQTFKEKLHYSNISEETTLKDMLLKIFEKHRLSIEAYHICLRCAPTLPLSLNQPVKHLLLNDLIVTDSTNHLLNKSSAGKERNEKRNSTGSAILSTNCKSASKRLSSHYTMVDNDENHRSNKSNRSSIFTSSIFTRDVMESNENNLAFVRRQCDEWLVHGLPKLAQLQCSINENDLTIEKDWQRFLSEPIRGNLPEMIKLQQETIYEMLTTEVSYIRQILTMTDIFMTSISILKSSERDGIFQDIEMEKLFSNIQDVLQGNLLFWKDILLPMKIKLEQTGLPMNPSDLKAGFLQFDIYFKPYLHYVLDQKTSAEYFKQKFTRDDLFQYLITWIEANFTNRLSFADLTIKPLQRLTRYKLLLEAIQKKTLDSQQKNDLHEMIEKVATFVNRINSKLHKQEQEERIQQINDRIGPYENVSAPPELTSILQEYHRDSMCNRLDLLQDMPLHIQGYRRQIIQQGPMKMKDVKNSQDVYCYLFSDMFLITKGGKRSGSTNSSSISTMNIDGQTNRPISNVLNKILKSPIRIDRIDVREYDRRGGNAEPNTASFVAIIFSEYNLVECAYLFQTNLSKQWIENIRQTKSNFQSLMEESKLKFQNLNHPITPPRTSVSTNTIHQSLPSLTSPSLNELNPSTDDHRRSSKVESDVFKIVEQTRRNSRTDRKNFGRYFTADGTSSNPSSSPIKQISCSSTTILKRMSWNNEQAMEKADSSLITNSFRSVHSSSGVSSTGSFLFSTDEDSSMTTTTSSSIPSMIPGKDENNLSSDTQSSTNQTIIESSSPEFSLRRTPYPSIKKRNRRQRIFPDNDVNSSTNTIVYESSKLIEENPSALSTSGNESDYDNNQSPTIPISTNHLFYSDELRLGDQNEIILNNVTHFEHLNAQSDTRKISLTRTHRSTSLSPPETFDDTPPPPANFLTYQKDPLITRRLLDIRSHLLLNTTLDATEV